jgi:hypothetical protein
MATKTRNRQRGDILPLKRVSVLVRNNLLYNGDTWRAPKSVGKIACAHGTDVASVVRLARDGHFSGAIPDPDLREGEFYTVPNAQFEGLRKSSLYMDVIDAIVENEVDFIERAIEYAEGDTAIAARRADTQTTDHHGVVIALKGAALHPDSQFWLNENDKSPELILPQAPSLDAIHGIYPVDIEAARSLKQELSRLAIQ